MIAITEINFDELINESQIMLDFDDILIQEGVIPDSINRKAKKIIEKWGKIDIRPKLAKLERDLKSQGVAVGKLNTIIQKNANNAISEIKSSQRNPKKIGSILVKHYNKTQEEVNELSDIEKWGGSIILLLFVLVINTFIYTVLINIGMMFGLPSIMPLAVAGIMVAPLVEESAKFISIKKKATGQYFTVFNIGEYILLVYQFTRFENVPLLFAALARLISVGLHGLLTWVQWKARKIGEERGETDDKTAKQGLMLAMMMHSTMNFLSIMARAAQ